MSNTPAREIITLAIGKSEALILFDLLTDFHSESSLQVIDNAERLALVRLHGALESTLFEQFSADYREIISTARNDLTRQWGNSGTEAVKSD
jgi:hypothetical protein